VPEDTEANGRAGWTRGCRVRNDTLHQVGTTSTVERGQLDHAARRWPLPRPARGLRPRVPIHDQQSALISRPHAPITEKAVFALPLITSQACGLLEVHADCSSSRASGGGIHASPPSSFPRTESTTSRLECLFGAAPGPRSGWSHRLAALIDGNRTVLNIVPKSRLKRRAVGSDSLVPMRRWGRGLASPIFSQPFPWAKGPGQPQQRCNLTGQTGGLVRVDFNVSLADSGRSAMSTRIRGRASSLSTRVLTGKVVYARG